MDELGGGGGNENYNCLCIDIQFGSFLIFLMLNGSLGNK